MDGPPGPRARQQGGRTRPPAREPDAPAAAAAVRCGPEALCGSADRRPTCGAARGCCGSWTGRRPALRSAERALGRLFGGTAPGRSRLAQPAAVLNASHVLRRQMPECQASVRYDPGMLGRALSSDARAVWRRASDEWRRSRRRRPRTCVRSCCGRRRACDRAPLLSGGWRHPLRDAGDFSAG